MRAAIEGEVEGVLLLYARVEQPVGVVRVVEDKRHDGPSDESERRDSRIHVVWLVHEEGGVGTALIRAHTHICVYV